MVAGKSSPRTEGNPWSEECKFGRKKIVSINTTDGQTNRDSAEMNSKRREWPHAWPEIAQNRETRIGWAGHLFSMEGLDERDNSDKFWTWPFFLLRKLFHSVFISIHFLYRSLELFALSPSFFILISFFLCFFPLFTLLLLFLKLLFLFHGCNVFFLCGQFLLNSSFPLFRLRQNGDLYIPAAFTHAYKSQYWPPSDIYFAWITHASSSICSNR